MVAIFTSIREGELEGLKKDDADILKKLGDSDVDRLDLDRSWDGVYFVLSDDASLLSGKADDDEVFYRAFLGGEELNREGLTYLGSSEVQEVYEAFEGITDDEFVGRFDPKEFYKAGLYAFDGGDESCADEDLAYLLENFRSLKSFYKRAAMEGKGVLRRIG